MAIASRQDQRHDSRQHQQQAGAAPAHAPLNADFHGA